jgi:UDPglucose 6-dehydrogenase
VRGYDINPNIQSDHIWIADSTSAACQDADIVFVAVPTPHAPEYGGETPSSHLPVRDFDYSHLRTALADVKSATHPSTLIVNISTVLPGTLRPMITALGIQDRFCYNPYLIAMGTVANDFVHPDIMMLGFDEWPTDEHQRQSDLLIDFYSSIQHSDAHITRGTWEEAECIKIFHNTYISAKVGIANMIQDVTQRIGHANPSVIAESLRHAERVVGPRYMEPGMGDGGPCHPRDNIALSWLAHELNLGYDLFHDIMRAREQQARLVAQSLAAHDLPIHILGRSFKAGTDLRDGSTAELVAHYCATEWDQPVEYDSVTDQPAVYLLAHPNDHHRWQFAQGSVVIDMYRQMPRDRADITVVWYGVRDGEPPPQ